MNRFKIIPFICCILLTLPFTSCSKKDKDNTKNLNNNTSATQSVNTDTEEMQDIYKQNNMLNDMTTVNLYFISKKVPKLAIEKREVLNLPDKQQMLKQVLSTLAYGPLTKLSPSIPPNFTVSDVFIVNKTAFVNLRKTGNNEGGIGGIESEQLFLYSIVNTTLALNKNLKNVKILINGEEAETLLGHINASGLLTFNKKIVK